MTEPLKILPAPLKELLGDSDQGPISADHIKRTMRAYGDRMSAGDVDGIVALFAPDSIITDPITTPPRSGAELRAFFQGALDAQGGFIEMRLEGEPRVAGNRGAAAYQARMTIDGEHVLVETLDVMTFNEKGLIASMDAYWGPSNIKASSRAPERLA